MTEKDNLYSLRAIQWSGDNIDSIKEFIGENYDVKEEPRGMLSVKRKEGLNYTDRLLDLGEYIIKLNDDSIRFCMQETFDLSFVRLKENDIKQCPKYEVVPEKTLKGRIEEVQTLLNALKLLERNEVILLSIETIQDILLECEKIVDTKLL